MSEWDSNKDTRQRIIDASIHLFSLKGYAGASTREIAKIAKVNIASLNYHFRSKQNLLQEVSVFVIDDFEKMLNEQLGQGTSAAEYSVKVFTSLIENELRYLNHCKLYLDAEDSPRPFGTQPLGYTQLNTYFSRDLSERVPEHEKFWLTSVIMSYITNMALMNSSSLGKKYIAHFMPERQKTVADYLHRLVSSLVRDLNVRYP